VARRQVPVDEIDFRENVRLEFVNGKKEEFLSDFRDAPEITQSALYSTVYKEAIGMFGGKPYGVVCSTFDFGPGTEDVELLRSFAAVSAMSHVPFLGNTDPGMFGRKSFQEIPQLKDLQAMFEEPALPAVERLPRLRGRPLRRHVHAPLHAPRALRDPRERAPRPRLRLQRGRDRQARALPVGRRLPGPAAKIADSFAKYRWCPNIIGPLGGGAVYNLPLHQYQQGGELKTKNPCEAASRTARSSSSPSRASARSSPQGQQQRRVLLGQLGPATQGVPAHRGGHGRPAQLHARHPPAVHVRDHPPRPLPQGPAARADRHVEEPVADLERELNTWIRQYVSDMPDPPPDVRSRKPLREAKVLVEEVPGQVGWYRCNLRVVPHLKYEGASFELSLVGKLDKTRSSSSTSASPSSTSSPATAPASTPPSASSTTRRPSSSTATSPTTRPTSSRWP
jgi:type VI secretion system protein ImpC